MKKAFTLIELLVVAAIICILVAIIIPIFRASKVGGKNTQFERYLHTLYPDGVIQGYSCRAQTFSIYCTGTVRDPQGNVHTEQAECNSSGCGPISPLR